jgi:hypothetical protein
VLFRSGIADEDFYLLQSQMQGVILGLIPQFDNPKDQYQANALLGLLVKESTYIQEIEKAENGLISLLKTPGLGIEKDKGKQAEVLLRNYVKQKASLLAQRSKDEAADAVKKSPLGMQERMGLLFSLNRLQGSNSYKEVRKADVEIKRSVDAASLRTEDRQQLQDTLDRYKEWKTFQVYRRKMDAVSSQIKAAEPLQQQPLEAIASAISSLQTLAEFKEIAAKLREAKESAGVSASQAGVIGDMEDALMLRAELFVAEKNKEDAQPVTGASTPAAPVIPPEGSPNPQEQARAVKEELQSREKEEEAADARLRQEQEQALAMGRADRSRRIADLLAIAATVIAVVCAALFCVFYFLRQQRAYRLKRFFNSDQRQFAIGIYENTRAVLAILGAGPRYHVPPLSYADSIQARYAVGNGIFRKLTEKFEEAKYSQHILSQEDAKLVLGYYNDFVRILLGRQGIFSLFFITYPRAILARRPFFIRA